MRQNKKILIIAGSHQREIGFSHPVIDLLLEDYRATRIQPREFAGVDNARKAQLWDLDELALVKIHKIGEPPQEYLRDLELFELFNNVEFKIQNMDNGAEYPERFDHGYQWTSVHDKIIDFTKPIFFIDLHSHHKYSEGISGTGAYIMSFAKTEHDELINIAMEKAYKTEPAIYGSKPENPCPVFKNIRVTKEQVTSGFSINELVQILTLPIGELNKDNEVYSSFMRRYHKLKEKAVREFHQKFGNQWYFNKPINSNERSYPNFCLEAVHWHKEGQKATARFISKYLVPLV